MSGESAISSFWFVARARQPRPDYGFGFEMKEIKSILGQKWRWFEVEVVKTISGKSN